MKCPICFGDVEYNESKRPTCPTCGWPATYVEHFRDMPEKLDLFYRLFRFFEREAGLRIEGEHYIGSMRVVMENIHEFIGSWAFSEDALAGMVYIIINKSRDGSIYELRAVYTNPYDAEGACEEIEFENEERQLKAKPHVEKRLLNHLYGSSMFQKLYDYSKKEGG